MSLEALLYDIFTSAWNFLFLGYVFYATAVYAKFKPFFWIGCVLQNIANIDSLTHNPSIIRFILAFAFIFISIKVYSKIPSKNTLLKKITTAETKKETKVTSEALCLFDLVEPTEKDNTNEIKVHVLSEKKGYYTDTFKRTEKNSALIDKCVDKSTGCLYMTITQQEGKEKRALVTKSYFEKAMLNLLK